LISTSTTIEGPLCPPAIIARAPHRAANIRAGTTDTSTPAG
jgi:hypothetical protein